MREYWITENINWLTCKSDWKGLKSIGMVKLVREIENKKTEEIRYFITSLKDDAKVFSKTARSHWGIENSLHCLYVNFNEDQCRVRKDYAP